MVSIARLERTASAADVEQLAKLLVDAIDSGAGVSFMAGLTVAEAAAWWRAAAPRATRR